MVELQRELLLMIERREKLMKKDNLIFAPWLKLGTWSKGLIHFRKGNSVWKAWDININDILCNQKSIDKTYIFINDWTRYDLTGSLQKITIQLGHKAKNSIGEQKEVSRFRWRCMFIGGEFYKAHSKFCWLYSEEKCIVSEAYEKAVVVESPVLWPEKLENWMWRFTGWTKRGENCERKSPQSLKLCTPYLCSNSQTCMSGTD